MSAGQARSVSLGDAKTALSLASMALVDRLCPDSRLGAAVRKAARLHVTLRGSKAPELDALAVLDELGVDARELEHQFQAGVYREMVYTLREHRGISWKPDVELHGREHIERALSEGTGAVLWAFPCTYGGLVTKKTLHANGYEVVMLSSHVHPYSGTRFGRRLLNPIRTGVEDRYLAERVVLQPGQETLAMRRVIELLSENKLVEITAIGASDAPASIPCLGGALNLALGAPTIAMMSRSPLIPCFTIPSDVDAGEIQRFDVRLATPLESDDAIPPRERAASLARSYAGLLESYVKKAPTVWRGWFNRTNWTPHRLDSSRPEPSKKNS